MAFCGYPQKLGGRDMSDDREIARELLQAVRKAVKATEKMMMSKDESVQVFAVDAMVKLSEMAITLLSFLKAENAKMIKAEERNPLARKAQLGQ